MYTVYTRDGCPYCTQIKQILTGIGESYQELELNKNFTREQFVEQFGHGATFPRVIKDGRLLGGCSEAVMYLRNEGLV